MLAGHTGPTSPAEPTPLVDTFFKLAFSHPRMIELLIRAHVPEWDDGVDYQTLDPLPSEHVTDDLNSLFSDMAWRLRSLDGGVEHVLMIEFQGRPERAMALRINVYGGLAVQRLLRKDAELRSGRRRLALASLVLYHGDRPWNAPTRLGDLFENSAPDSYRLISQRPPDAPAPTALDLPQVLLDFACSPGAEQTDDALENLVEAIKACGDDDLARHLTKPVRRVLIDRGIFNEQWGEGMDMETMRVEYLRSVDRLKKRERRKGREQGRAQGRDQGRVSLLRQLTDRKFGAETAETVSRLLTEATDPAYVTRVSEAILDCDTTEDFLARVGRN